jgi:hypothetical protein
MRTVRATRYVTPLREGGSMPGLVEADDDGLYVLKFHGAAQGPRVLVAEIIAGEIGRALGLTIPELVLIELDAKLGAAEPDTEVRELIERSDGLNLGVDFLPGALPYRPTVGAVPDARSAANTVWFDALMTNPDRTFRNPNILVWHKRDWLIDHGAALYIHYTWRDPAAHAKQAFERIADHILLPHAGSIHEADERLTPQLSAEFLRSIVDLVPEDWLADKLSSREIGGPEAQRQAYVEYLSRRLAAPRAWVDEAERAREAARALGSSGVGVGRVCDAARTTEGTDRG